MNSTLASLLNDMQADSPATLLCEGCFGDWNNGAMPIDPQAALNLNKILRWGLYPTGNAWMSSGNCDVCNWPLADSFAYTMSDD